MKKIYILLITLLFLGELQAQTWDGSTSTDWDEPTNWNTNAVPTPSGIVIIPASLSTYPKLSTDVAVSRIEMATGSSIDVNGKTITMNNATSINYTNWDGATISNSNGATDINITIALGNSGHYTRVYGCTFSDNVIFNLSSGSNDFFEASIGANTYMGNATFNAANTGAINISSVASSIFNGNVTINRTVAGLSNIFTGGSALNITGNFSYSNTAGGAVTIGNLGKATGINGMLNVNCDFAAFSNFYLYKVANQTSGSSVTVKQGANIKIEQNNMKITELRLTNYKTNYVEILSNQIVGNVFTETATDFSSGHYTTFYGNTVTGNCSFINNGTNDFWEGNSLTQGNTFNGNTTIQGNSSGALNISQNGSSSYNGNLSIMRTAIGATNVFQGTSAVTITGDFSYTNNVGGTTKLGNTTANTTVNGLINIDANFTSPNKIEMNRFVNSVTVGLKRAVAGGHIDIKNAKGWEFLNNNLILDYFSITDYISGGYGYLNNNIINAAVTISTSTDFVGGYYTTVYGNTFTGSCNFSNNSTNEFFEAHTNQTQANIYNGNVIYTASGSGGLNIGYQGSSTYNGNVTVNRTVAGSTDLFHGNSATEINGDFNYTNNAGGIATIGNNNNETKISGAVNINSNLTTSARFYLRKINNSGTVVVASNKQKRVAVGGGIILNNSIGFNFENNILENTPVTITNYQSGDYSIFLNNKITGNVTISSSATYTGGYNTTIYGNTIVGNSIFSNNGSNDFYEAHSNQGQANTYTGTVEYNGNSAGSLFIGNVGGSTYNGNITINRTVVGPTNVFYGSSATVITGSFAYNNNAGGATTLGNNTNETMISGAINITANEVAAGNFIIRKINNIGIIVTAGMNVKNARVASGGTITISNTRGFTLENSNLDVTAINITNYISGAYGELINNIITGDVTIATANDYGGGYSTSIYGNTINGNSNFQNNGSNQWYEGHSNAIQANIFNGNVSMAAPGGTYNSGVNTGNSYGGNVTLNSTSALNFQKAKFIGAGTHTLQQLGIQPLTIPGLIMDKIGGTLILANPVTVASSLTLTNGNIVTTSTNLLTMNDNAVVTGGSLASFVAGPMAKKGNDIFSFPIGKNSKYAPISITAPASASTSLFTAEYKDSNPTTDGYNVSQKAATLDHILAQEYWLLDGNSPVFVTLGWDAARSGQVNPLASARVAHWTGSTWEDRGNSETTGNPNIGTVKSGAAIPSFSPFVIASTEPFVPLPLNLISFTGKNTENGNLLNWKTANEVAFSHFEIERSIDAKKFEKIGEKMATGGPAEKVEYEYIDDLSQLNSELDEKYYRLKMVNLDGSFKFSKIVNIDTRRNSDFVIFPNPAIEYFKIVNNEKIQMVEIVDLAGNTIKTFRKNIDNQYNIKDLTKGVYIIKTTSNVGFNIRKLVIN